MKNKESGKNKFPVGSAFILAVVLTTLLAIVGAMFLMAARVNKMSTSAISENRELNFAVETVIAKISQELVLDTPGVADQEYYDYPGLIDRWLASPEPYKDGTNYKWRQVSDVTGYIRLRYDDPYNNYIEDWGKWPASSLQTDVQVDAEGYNENGNTLPYYINRKVITEYPEIALDRYGQLYEQWADADGDGVADSKWIELDDITSSKGKRIYAAIRIVDNCGMINLNTAYKFDEADANMVDGSSQLQINLMALSWRPGTSPYNTSEEEDLLKARANDGIDVVYKDLDEYEKNVVWRYYSPEGKYTPFDISDELEFRNRFLLNHTDIDTRSEAWGDEFGNAWTSSTPFKDIDEWFISAYDDGDLDPNYAYRHIATTYNIDRIIDPCGDDGDVRKMININEETDVKVLYETLVKSIDTNIDNDDQKEIKKRYAQLAANLADFADKDIDVKIFDPPDPGNHDKDVYYGFEAQPFITEVGMIVDAFPESGRNYFAVELYNPFNRTIDLEDFELLLIDSDAETGKKEAPYTIQFINGEQITAKGCFVIANTLGRFNIYTSAVKQDPKLRFFGHWIKADRSGPPVDRRPRPDKSEPPVYIGWTRDTTLLLKRKLLNGDEIYADKQVVNRTWGGGTRRGRYFERDVRDWHIVYPLEEDSSSTNGTLGSRNGFYRKEFEDRDYDFSFFLPNPINKEIITIGDIPQILTIGPPEVDSYSNNTIGEQLQQTSKSDEDKIRVDLQNPYHRNIFQYLTVFDPTDDGIDNDGDGVGENEKDNDELKIPGRININTAPWYVIAQLPWVSDELAQAIVAYRDKLESPVDYGVSKTGRYDALRKVSNTSFNFNNPDDIREFAGFASIGELNFAIAGSDDKYSIQKNALDNKDLDDFPDLTRDGSSQGDGIEDDFEERDVIFSRISNLVTVRSDVFTAYILIRIGSDGPQKRAVAILDRSGVNSPDDKVRIVALHYVPDPR